MRTAWRVLMGARKYWLQLGIGFAGIVMATIAGFLFALGASLVDTIGDRR
ncbi:hypothetical protein ACFSQ7_14595 [Paenibacillus rhizoplanae]